MAVILPAGTYAKMMDGTLRTLVEAAAAGAFHEGQGPSSADTARKADPHYDERMRIFMDILFDELKGIMNKEEPGIRQAMARAYARRFTTAEMREMDVFLATPVGRKFAVQSITLMEDPELLARMMSLEPRMRAELPRIIEKVMGATSHLPGPALEEPTS
ncbi:MAG TPA: DUF2059 domain-containing protein [Allosphingosinicella sp.]|nr:DUF2059 domain-containing protein [Allosphingosinicella sp.]